jgi:hypothetical protein
MHCYRESVVKGALLGGPHEVPYYPEFSILNACLINKNECNICDDYNISSYNSFLYLFIFLLNSTKVIYEICTGERK